MRISALLSRYLNSRLKFGMYLLFFFSNSGNGQYHRVFESLFGRQHLCRDHSICDDPISCRLYKCQKVCWSLKMTSLGSRSPVVEENINRSRALFRLYTQCKDGIEATFVITGIKDNKISVTLVKESELEGISRCCVCACWWWLYRDEIKVLCHFLCSFVFHPIERIKSQQG